MKTAAFLLLAATALTAADPRLPQYTREQLPNGVVIYLLPKPSVPLVNFRILVRGGVESEPVGLSGIAAATAQLLRSGSARRTATQFSEELDSLGGTFQAAVTPQYTMVASEFLKKDFAAGLDLTADAILHPTFPEAEVKKVLARATDTVKGQKDNPQIAIGPYFNAFFFGPTHPYGRPTSEATLTKIDRTALAAYAQTAYSGKNLVVIVAGDFDTPAATAALRDTFGKIPAGTAFTPAKDVKPTAGARLLLIDKPDATQTYFRIGQSGIARTDRDRTAITLINTLFGGRFTSMLNDALRVNSGLTYGASSVVDENRLPGAITIATYTKTETTEKAIDMALDQLKALNEKGITADQLASAKAYVKGIYPTRYLETADQLAAMLGDIEIYGLNKGEVDDLFSRIDAVTLEQANAIAKRYFQPKDLTFVVLGNAAKIREAVKKYAPTIQERKASDPGFGN